MRITGSNRGPRETRPSSKTQFDFTMGPRLVIVVALALLMGLSWQSSQQYVTKVLQGQDFEFRYYWPTTTYISESTHSADPVSSNQNNIIQNTSSDWLDRDRFINGSVHPNCFYVEDLCVSANRLFYRASDNESHRKKHQPEFVFELYVSR
jgi:hypothetical protein